MPLSHNLKKNDLSLPKYKTGHPVFKTVPVLLNNKCVQDNHQDAD